MGRYLAVKLSERLGRQVMVDNRPGADGVIGSDQVAKSAPDGYTLLIISVSYAMNAALHKLPYDPVKSFTPIAQIGIGPSVIAATPSLPVNNVRQLVALAKARPGQLHYASAGIGGVNHFAGELFKLATQTDIVHVPYKGGGPAIVDVISGQCDLLVVNIGPVLAQIRAGKLNPLAVTSKARSSVLPNIPTVAESGLPGYESTTWYGFLAQVAVSREIVARVNSAAAAAIKHNETRERFAALAAEPATNTPEQFAAFLRQDMQDWAKVVKASGAKLD